MATKTPKDVWQLCQHRKLRHFHETSTKTSLKLPSSASARKRNKPPMPVGPKLNQFSRTSKDRANAHLYLARTPRRQSRSPERAARLTTLDLAGASVWLKVVGSRVPSQRMSLQGTADVHQDRCRQMDIVYRVTRTRRPLDLGLNSSSSHNTTPMHRAITSVTGLHRRVLHIPDLGDSRLHRRRHSRDRDQDLDRVREAGRSKDRYRRCLRLRRRHQHRTSHRR